jgi:hypothetical protein
MKRILLALVVLLNAASQAQNTYDIYNTCGTNYPAVYDGGFVTGYVAPGYEGEYQIFLHDLDPNVGHYWDRSFPFKRNNL